MCHTLQDIVLTFPDVHTDERKHGRTGQNHHASGHTTLGEGIITSATEIPKGTHLSPEPV